MRPSRPSVLLAFAAGAFLVPGCGGGDDAGGATDGGPSDSAPSDAPLLDGATASAMGTLVVVADASFVGRPCAAATSLSAAPDNVVVGSSIALSASGVDPAYRSADVTLMWEASGSVGSLSPLTGATVLFHCTSAGTATVTVTASMANGGISCPGTGSLSALLRCVQP
jgi:hypothetical protein